MNIHACFFRLSHNVFLTPLLLHIRPHNVVLATSQYTRNVSVLYTNLKISHICLSSDPVISTFFIYQIETSTLRICNIYSVNVGSFRTLGQMIHTKVPRTRCCTNFPKYLKILEVQTPIILPIFDRSNWNLDVAHLQYIFSHCVKFKNPRTKVSYQSAADKVLHKHPRISQNRLSSDPRHFDNIWSIKLKSRRCTPAIYIL